MFALVNPYIVHPVIGRCYWLCSSYPYAARSTQLIAAPLSERKFFAIKWINEFLFTHSNVISIDLFDRLLCFLHCLSLFIKLLNTWPY